MPGSTKPAAADTGDGQPVVESPAPPDAPDPAADAAALQTAIKPLVEEAGFALRAANGHDPAGTLDVRAAGRAAGALRALRARLQDHADGIDHVTPDDAEAHAAADLLRRLLEGIHHTRIPLPGDGERPEGDPTEDEFASALTAAEALVPSPTVEAPYRWTVRNLTPYPLDLAGRDGTPWALPAYGQREFDVDPERLLDLHVEIAAGRVDIQRRPAPEGTNAYVIALGAYVWIVPIGIGIGLAWGVWAWVGFAAVVASIPVIAALTSKDRRERLRAMVGEMPAWAAQTTTFAVAVLVALVLPAAAIVFGADLRALVRHVVARDASNTEYLTFVARLMQLGFVAIASALPALLYFQFDRDRLSTLREKFIHQIFRLDPKMKTVGDVDAKYGRLIDEIYGPERSGRYRKLLPGRRAPIFVTTLLIVLGWLLVLLNPDVHAIPDGSTLGKLFAPRHTAVAFAFLGAYFFTLFALLRGYVRRDLRPKSYTDISVRILAVAILAWVLELALPDDATYLLVFAFLTGMVPQAGVNKLREFAQGRAQKQAQSNADDPLAALDDPLPLTGLEGIDLYDRTRLSSEGVTNVEALAHHDLVELMLQTRIPVPRLIDWVDQAILHLHVTTQDRATLRNYGVRTATDLLLAAERAEDEQRGDAFRKILDPDGDGTRVRVILDTMADEEWLRQLRAWHGIEPKPKPAT
jgi:hypothetical protein